MSVIVIETQTHLPPWMQEHRGLWWMDMPSSDRDVKKLNFALFRRGLYDPNLEAVSDEKSGLNEEQLKMARRDAGGKVLVNAGRGSSFGTVPRLTPRAQMARAARKQATKDAQAEDLTQRRERQQALLDRYLKAKETRGFVRALLNLDVTAHSALARAQGLGRGCQRPLRSGTLDRIERAFKQLKQEGWNL